MKAVLLIIAIIIVLRLVGRFAVKLEAKRAREMEERMLVKHDSHHSPPDWLERRAYVIKRDNFQCTKCGSKTDLHVHHVVPRRVRFDHSVENLTTLCYDCHGKAHGRKFHDQQTLRTRRYLKRFSKRLEPIRARVFHTCDSCGGTISPGDSYLLVTKGSHNFSIRHGYPGGAKVCLKCRNAWDTDRKRRVRPAQTGA
jgi:5-methylcytosine-specific restriction endonuclease McrA